MMHTITIKDKEFTPYISQDQIANRIKELARQLKADYHDKEPLFVAILNGSFLFAADLFKLLEFDCSISFVKVASYHGTTSTGKVVDLIGLDEQLRGRHVIVLEDIVDTGRTLSHLLPDLENQNPASLKVMSLLTKPSCLKFPLDVHYVGFEIPDAFIVGYGLDYDGLGRNLRDIYQIRES